MKVLTRQEEQVLLAVHHLKDNAYLIPIREQIKEYTGKYYSVGTIYAPLNRLTVSGCLTSFLGDASPERGGKAIKYYKITADGYRVLAGMKKVREKMWAGFEVPDLSEEPGK